MKNFEAYEEKIKELNYNFAIKNDECVRCINICERCEFISNPFGSCPQNKTKWLYKEYIEPKPKVKIPLATKYFLESLNDKYEWIFLECIKSNDLSNTFFQEGRFYPITIPNIGDKNG